MSRKKIVARNIKFLSVSTFLDVLVNFLLVPFIILHIGKEDYGVFILLFTIYVYFDLFDFGIPSAIIKYTAEYQITNEQKKLEEILNSALTIYVTIGFVVFVGFIVISQFFSRWFNVSSFNYAEGRIVVILMGIGAFLSWPLKLFTNSIRGLQLYNWSVVFEVFCLIGKALLIFFLLKKGYGLFHLVLINIVFIIINALLCAIAVRRFIPYWFIKFPYFNAFNLKFIFNFSFLIFVSSLLKVIFFSVDRILVGVYISVTAVAVYSVGSYFQHFVRLAIGIITEPMWPATAAMEGKSDLKGQQDSLIKGTKYTLWLLLPFIAILISFAEPFILHWLGNDFKSSVCIAQILLGVWVFQLFFEVGWNILSAKGLIKKMVPVQLINVLAVIATGIFLTKYFNSLGIAIGKLLSVSLFMCPLIIYTILKTLKVSFSYYFNHVIKINIIVFLLVVIASNLMIRFLYPLNIYVTLLEMAAIYVVTLVATFIFTFNSAQKEEMKKMIAFGAF